MKVKRPDPCARRRPANNEALRELEEDTVLQAHYAMSHFLIGSPRTPGAIGIDDAPQHARPRSSHQSPTHTHNQVEAYPGASQSVAVSVSVSFLFRFSNFPLEMWSKLKCFHNMLAREQIWRIKSEPALRLLNLHVLVAKTEPDPNRTLNALSRHTPVHGPHPTGP
ncbi:hypothetical protein VTN00DRAFT_7302 [Thermoascus crustaceus]|uniref:uncharacterized protein n=1 Tax=Thermoascus crustaceus TaxID=5088 RepID=UPI0037432CC2